MRAHHLEAHEGLIHDALIGDRTVGPGTLARKRVEILPGSPSSKTSSYGTWQTCGSRCDSTYSRLMSWVAVERAIRIARQRGLPADLPR
jgi:hypothetical protein